MACSARAGERAVVQTSQCVVACRYRVVQARCIDGLESIAGILGRMRMISCARLATLEEYVSLEVGL